MFVLISSFTLAKSLNLALSQFLHLKMKMIISHMIMRLEVLKSYYL